MFMFQHFHLHNMRVLLLTVCAYAWDTLPTHESPIRNGNIIVEYCRDIDGISYIIVNYSSSID